MTEATANHGAIASFRNGCKIPKLGVDGIVERIFMGTARGLSCLQSQDNTAMSWHVCPVALPADAEAMGLVLPGESIHIARPA